MQSHALRGGVDAGHGQRVCDRHGRARHHAHLQRAVGQQDIQGRTLCGSVARQCMYLVCGMRQMLKALYMPHVAAPASGKQPCCASPSMPTCRVHSQPYNRLLVLRLELHPRHLIPLRLGACSGDRFAQLQHGCLGKAPCCGSGSTPTSGAAAANRWHVATEACSCAAHLWAPPQARCAPCAPCSCPGASSTPWGAGPAVEWPLADTHESNNESRDATWPRRPVAGNGSRHPSATASQWRSMLCANAGPHSACCRPC